MKRPHIVLDTNVLISALLFGGVPREVLGLVITGEVECSLSSAVLDELRDVLQRPKFGFSPQQAMTVVEELCGLCTIVSPSKSIRVVDADPDDDRVLECAITARADAVVSGDAHLLALGLYENIHILSPSEFLQMVRTDSLSRRKRRERRR